MSELSRLLKSLNNDEWSGQRIVDEARKHGHTISRATVTSYMHGRHPANPSPQVLETFAAVFSTNVNLLRFAVDLPPLGEEPFELGPEASRLNREQRDAVRAVVNAMLNTTPDPTWAPEQLDLAADTAHGESQGQAQARHTDTLGEEPQDTP